MATRQSLFTCIYNSHRRREKKKKKAKDRWCFSFGSFFTIFSPSAYKRWMLFLGWPIIRSLLIYTYILVFLDGRLVFDALSFFLYPIGHALERDLDVTHTRSSSPCENRVDYDDDSRSWKVQKKALVSIFLDSDYAKVDSKCTKDL